MLYIAYVQNIDTIYSNIFTKKHRFALKYITIYSDLKKNKYNI